MTKLQWKLENVRRQIRETKRHLLLLEDAEQEFVCAIVAQAIANESESPTSNTVEAADDKEVLSDN